MVASAIPAPLQPVIEAKLRDLAARGYRSSGELRIRCPNPDHDDAHPSASWNWRKAAWSCQACGAAGGWKRLCQLTGIPLSGNGQARKASRRRLEHYDYPADDGRVRRKIRTEPKGFTWCVVDGGEEITPTAAGVSGNPRCLYRLDEVREAIRHGLPVLVVEGEKAADRIVSLGLPATCNPEGAARVGQRPKWRESYAQAFTDGDIVVCGDLDDAGQAHAAEIAATSSRYAACVRVLDLAELARSTGLELPEKSGLDDWVERRRQAGASRADIARELLEWIETLEDYRPPAELQAIPTQRQAESGPVVVCMADVEPEEIRWLWYPRIARGKVTILEGDPGVGKSYVTAAIAAALSSGEGLPDCESFDPCRVLMLTAEDGLGDTLRPRLDSLEADVANVFACEVAIDFSTPEGLDFARRQIEKHRPALVTIDPIVAYVGTGTDTHRANQVRSILAPLSGLAAEFGCAILVVRHLSKSGAARSIYRGQGSIDFTAAARSVLLAGFDPADEEHRALVQIKTNLGPMAPALGFEIPDGRFRWTGDSSLTASDLLSGEGSSEEKSAEEEAREFLLELLGAGRVPASGVLKHAEKDGIKERTLRTAKRKLGVRSVREGFGPGSACYWELPASRPPNP